MRHSTIVNGKYLPTVCGRGKPPCKGELEIAADGSRGVCKACKQEHRFDDPPRARKGRA